MLFFIVLKFHFFLMLSGHPRIHQASSGACAVSPRRTGPLESVHCRMAEILHTVFIFTNAFWTARNCSAGKDNVQGSPFYISNESCICPSPYTNFNRQNGENLYVISFNLKSKTTFDLMSIEMKSISHQTKFIVTLYQLKAFAYNLDIPPLRHALKHL